MVTLAARRMTAFARNLTTGSSSKSSSCSMRRRWNELGLGLRLRLFVQKEVIIALTSVADFPFFPYNCIIALLECVNLPSSTKFPGLRFKKVFSFSTGLLSLCAAGGRIVFKSVGLKAAIEGHHKATMIRRQHSERMATSCSGFDISSPQCRMEVKGVTCEPGGQGLAERS